MRLSMMLTAALLLAACGKSNEQQLEEAANHSDPAAAQVLDNAAENGTDPQQALQDAGNAAVASNDMTPPSAQARPNTPENPNPPASGEPIEKNQAGSR